MENADNADNNADNADSAHIEDIADIANNLNDAVQLAKRKVVAFNLAIKKKPIRSIILTCDEKIADNFPDINMIPDKGNYSADFSETLSDSESDTEEMEIIGPAAAESLEFLETMPKKMFDAEFGDNESRIRQVIRDYDRDEGIKSYVERQKLGVVKTTMRAAMQMKHNWIEFHSEQMFQCFYRGNLAILRCDHCFFCFDCFPCKEKREYAVPKSSCVYCTGHFNHVGAYTYFRNVKPHPFLVKSYVISEDKNMKYPI